MAKVAQLLIGSLHNLHGRLRNLELMRAALGAYGYAVLPEPPPGRDAMLGCLRDLVTRVEAGDEVAIYYMGHGGQARFVTSEGVSPIHRYLTTGDGEHRRTCFRGLLDDELQHVLDQLCAKSDSVTVMLESCYAGGMADVRSRGWSTVDVNTFEHAEPHVARSRAMRRSEPIIVAAVQEGRKAGESRVPPHEGYFTSELAAALLRARERGFTWQRLMLGVRRAVVRRRGSEDQLPHVIGPAKRVVLDPRELAEASWYELEGGERRWARAGALHGFAPGDVVALADVEGRALGEATLREVEADRAHLDDTVPREAAMCSMLAKRAPLAVALAHAASDELELRAAIERSPWLRVAEHAEAASLVVSRHAGGFVLRDASDEAPLEVSPNQLVDELEQQAHRREFLAACQRLASPPPRLGIRVFVDDAPLCAGGRVEVGARMRFAIHHEGDRQSETLFLTLVSDDVDRRVRLLASGRPGGLNLFCEVRDDHAPLSELELELTWPDGVAPTPRRATLFFVVSARALFLSGGRTRAPADAPRDAACWLQRVDYELHPRATP
jgi:hypothetical protein